ncbi:hypothetical protein [Deinococcus cellulosilyticus]|uniref:Uncharacterized protein n=1 Tax=Deinococcus cellulosilyticus (strain DSM 18568 / NBRC 106333 / KACC 11606 / 5516J-15) TaxID=1223518 RepID=A0A511NA72_DEIC1|nr:hypothetical protein [Deinococcus cellulosilyticus]GEM49713.1 hypothetical protein DC3_53480 [Deinococcus cellulosilyticus NBRC 106333 = KACC 11606]
MVLHLLLVTALGMLALRYAGQLYVRSSGTPQTHLLAGLYVLFAFMNFLVFISQHAGNGALQAAALTLFFIALPQFISRISYTLMFTFQSVYHKHPEQMHTITYAAMSLTTLLAALNILGVMFTGKLVTDGQGLFLNMFYVLGIIGWVCILLMVQGVADSFPHQRKYALPLMVSVTFGPFLLAPIMSGFFHLNDALVLFLTFTPVLLTLTLLVDRAGLLNPPYFMPERALRFVPNPVMVTDPDDLITWMNEEARKLDAAELGRPALSAFYSSEEFVTDQNQWEPDREYRYVRTRYKEYLLRKQPINSNEHELLGYLYTAQEVTVEDKLAQHYHAARNHHVPPIRRNYSEQQDS